MPDAVEGVVVGARVAEETMVTGIDNEAVREEVYRTHVTIGSRVVLSNLGTSLGARTPKATVVPDMPNTRQIRRTNLSYD